MTTKEAYYYFSLLVNQNAERKNINIDIENFVLLYNREKSKWIADYINNNIATDDILNIAELVVHDYKLEKLETKSTHVLYKTPDNLFTILSGNSFSTAKKGNCEGIIYNWFKKPNDLNIQYEDKFTQPSFEWERGLGEIYDRGIAVYKKDFEILDTYISYYREPCEIDIEGYIKIDGTPSKTINPDISNFLVHKIIDKIVLEISREFKDTQKFQLDQTRLT